VLDCTPLLEQLGPILAQATEAAEELLSVLLREREALGQRALEAIQEMAERKDRLIQQLEGLSSRQDTLLRHAGIDPQGAKLEVELRAMGARSLAEQWSALRSILKDCQRENQINGGIIEISRRFAEQVLDVLRGPAPDARLYGPSGETKTGLSGRGPIATA
jgi:flagella synthesis protein FlgN